MESAYSIHNMVQHGLLRSMQPGEWYGPQTVAHVLREMVAEHEKRTGRVSLAVLVSDDGTIYLDEVYKLCASTPPASAGVSGSGDSVGDETGPLRAAVSAEAAACTTALQETDSCEQVAAGTASGCGEGKAEDFFDPLLHLTPEEAARSELEMRPWKQALLILIPVRLGLGSINPCYAEGAW
mgnify:CR=1 FL=1